MPAKDAKKKRKIVHRCTQMNTDKKIKNICVYLCASVDKILPFRALSRLFAGKKSYSNGKNSRSQSLRTQSITR